MNSAHGFAGPSVKGSDPQSLGSLAALRIPKGCGPLAMYSYSEFLTKGTGKDIAQAMAEEEEASWDQTLDEWLISEGYCYAAGMAQLEDGNFYAAAPVADEAGWGFIFKEDHEQMIMQDDMTEKKMAINEGTALKFLVDNHKAPPTGLWFGGEKYAVTRVDKNFESGDASFVFIFAAKPKKGVSIAITKTQVICAFYDEEKGQVGGNCTKAIPCLGPYFLGFQQSSPSALTRCLWHHSYTRLGAMAEEEEASWDQTLDEWLISEGYCYAAGMAQLEDGNFYAAAPVAEEAGWGFIYKDDHEEMIMQDDMTEKKMTINEGTALKFLADNHKAPPTGLWFGGEKYAVTRVDKNFESGDASFVFIFAAKPKKGVSVAITKSQVICGFYDEEKGQVGGNCTKAVVAFAEYMVGLGY
ncbi:Pfn [Symbiodinium necroappetens]|uniref:Profilin n=1 Tax=Symbiodinium necroappetens TaxID=1628268 RepID=A0A813B8N7_9DINO|nr:Pfn [Symbiodinium necroappetens]